MTVPDFAGERPGAFEIRTLYFLASWISSGNVGRGLTLHLACVGEPPASVRELAKAAGARISVHAPKRIAGVRVANKFRGFEVERESQHLLLVDTDVIFPGRLDLSGLLPGSIAVAPAFKGRVPAWVWEKAYAAVGMPLPEERMVSQATELECEDIPSSEKQEAGGGMLPYYNAGVFLVPWSVPLADVWEETLGRVQAALEQTPDVPASLLRSDQTGFAIALQKLKRQGIPLERLPDVIHGHRLHLYRRRLTLEQIQLLHFTGSFSSKRADPDPRKWMRLSIKHFNQQLWDEYLASDMLVRPVHGFLRCWLPARLDGRRLGRLLERLHRDYVEPAFRSGENSC